MKTTTTNPFRKAKIWFANKFLFSFTFILTFLLLMAFIPYQSQAQQNPPSYPFSLDLNLGSGLIGNSNISPAFQPELGFSYMPGRLGAGLNAGFMSYNSSFNADQYAAGFEDFTSISKNGEKWTSFFVGIGPRFEFGSGSRLPITFRSSLDLALTYNSPPESSVDFNDPTGSSGDSRLQLSGFNPGDNYSKWSTSLRPEFQIQFSPGGSDRFAINVTTGIQHRLTKNEFTYTQKDLSKVRRMDNPQEMFFQFDNAPEIQRRAAPPQTNLFTSVGIKIKFGKSKQVHKEEVIHRDIASRAAPDGSGVGDCDDSDDSRCIKPGEMASDDADSDGDGIDDGTETVNDGSGAGDCDDGDTRCTPSRAQDYNSSRSNRPNTIADGVGDADSDGDGIDDGTNKTSPPTTKFYEDGKWYMMCNGAPELDPISQSATYSEFEAWLADCENYGTGDVGDYPPVDEAYSQFTSRVNLTDAVETAQDYNAAPPTKDDSFSESEKGLFQSASRVMEEQEAMRNAAVMARMANPAGTIIKLGSITAKGKKPLGLPLQNGESPLYQGKETGGENPLYEGQANDGDSDNNDNEDPAPVQRYDIQPSSYCMEVATMKMSTNSQKAMRGSSSDNRASLATDYNSSRSNTTSSITRPDDSIGSDSTDVAKATSHNASRSNRSQGVTDQDGDTDIDTDSTRISNATDYNSSRSNTTSSVVNPDNTGDGLGNDSTRIASATDYNSSRSNTTSSIADLGGDLDGDGFPDLLENASLTMTKRKRPGRAKYGDITLKKSMNNGGDLDGDGLDDASGLNMEPEIQMTLVADPLVAPGNTDGSGDFDDGDGLMDVLESATYSISKRSARTGRTAMKNDQESGWQETPASEVAPPDDVYQWTYKLNALSDNEDLPGNGTLTLIMSGGKVHFNVLFDPDSDEDGYGELLKNSSFSISKRSARTGRNPQTGRE